MVFGYNVKSSPIVCKFPESEVADQLIILVEDELQRPHSLSARRRYSPLRHVLDLRQIDLADELTHLISLFVKQRFVDSIITAVPKIHELLQGFRLFE